ncbi:DUF4832 domain-containing protein [bacterium]|nr:MAG: DUF4832 domain-containing protein [bacterium]
MIPGLLLLTAPQIVRPAPAPGPLDNPLKGWCSYLDAGPIDQPYAMAFLYVPWKELEPERGRYAFERWEKKAWSHPGAKGKHIVFRIYADYPSKPSGVPDWLRKEGVKMTRYTEEGGGESPDYNDPRMVEGMERLIAALGKRYNPNPRVAFVQFGLLGFWGEWHTYPRPELFASEATAARVLDAARRAFPDRRVMTRYPSGYAGRQSWLGFFDDYFPEDTEGEEDWQFLPRLRASKRENAWKTVPFGGEMVPGGAKRFLGDGFATTMKRVEEGHFSWLGPYTPAIAGLPDPALRARSGSMVRRLGYEYRLDEIRLPREGGKGSAMEVEVRGTNQGVAPFYYAWPVELALSDAQGRIAQRWTVKADIQTWLPGPFRFASRVRLGVKPGSYRLMLGIRDPWTGKPAIGFANALPRRGGWTQLAPVRVRP